MKIKCAACEAEPEVKKVGKEWVVRCTNPACQNKPKLIMTKTAKREDAIRKWRATFGTSKEELKAQGKEASRSWAWKEAPPPPALGHNTEVARDTVALAEFEAQRRTKADEGQKGRGRPPKKVDAE